MHVFLRCMSFMCPGRRSCGTADTLADTGEAPWGGLEGVERSGLGLRCACQLHPPGWPAAIFRYGGRLLMEEPIDPERVEFGQEANQVLQAAAETIDVPSSDASRLN